jgi:hypothetical protein
MRGELAALDAYSDVDDTEAAVADRNHVAGAPVRDRDPQGRRVGGGAVGACELEQEHEALPSGGCLGEALCGRRLSKWETGTNPVNRPQ